MQNLVEMKIVTQFQKVIDLRARNVIRMQIFCYVALPYVRVELQSTLQLGYWNWRCV